MTELEKYEAVNKCETVEELSEIILKFANGDGMIEGRIKEFNAERMVEGLKAYMVDEAAPNVLTRNYGIRQQAMYIKYYYRA
jgi:hypothetical protein